MHNVSSCQVMCGRGGCQQPAGRHCMLLEQACYDAGTGATQPSAGGSLYMMQSQQTVEAGLTCAKPGMSSMV